MFVERPTFGTSKGLAPGGLDGLAAALDDSLTDGLADGFADISAGIEKPLGDGAITGGRLARPGGGGGERRPAGPGGAAEVGAWEGWGGWVLRPATG
jgi:hypothetical protein